MTAISECPYCKSNGNPVIIQTSTSNFPAGMAVECTECGVRSMSADQADSMNWRDKDNLAIRFWNDLAKKCKE